jgi:hypothetical protein
MKKLLILVSLGLLICGAAMAQVAKGGTLYVGAKTLKLKSSTGFFAGTRGTLSYGDPVTVLQVNGKWVEVRSVSSSSISGWTASSNFSTRRVVAGTSGTATAKEVAMAGKGFNEEVENAYKAKGQLNYADVDKTEAQTVSEPDLLKFLTEGRLLTGDK